MEKFKLIDTTLREGEQTPGVLFSLVQKKEIIKQLVHFGIDEIELGIASSYYPEIPQLIDHCQKKYGKQRFSLWARCRKEDIEFAALSGVKCISLSIPVSDLHLHQKLEKSRQWAVQALKKNIVYAQHLGLEVSVGFEDATRGEPAFIEYMALVAENTGAVRVRLADTVGITSPGRIAKLVEETGKVLSNTELGVHTHNDFGMATGNAIAALESGAKWADGAMLGLGERAGCAPLEQLAAYSAFICNDNKKNIQSLKMLAEFIATITRRPVSANQPLFGSDIFTCETGLHVQGLLKKPETYEPFPPERVGATRKLKIGAKSGRHAIQKQIQGLGHSELSEPVLDKCVQLVRQAASELGRSLSNEELLAICKM